MKVDVDAAVEDTRDIFEEEIFKKYFIGSIKKNPQTGWLSTPADLKNKAEFLRKDEAGNYVEPHLDEMWFGWKLASKNTLIGLAEMANIKLK